MSGLTQAPEAEAENGAKRLAEKRRVKKGAGLNIAKN
jgi:hypothetical protein